MPIRKLILPFFVLFLLSSSACAADRGEEGGSGAQYTNSAVIAVVNQGIQKYQAGELDEAIASWEKALAMDPKVPKVAEWIKSVKAEKAQGKVEKGKTAPEFEAKEFLNTKETLSLAKWKGSIAVVEFWATWCPPCRQSIPHLNGIYRKYKDKGLKIVGLTDEDSSKVKEFMKKIPIEYPVGTGSGSGSVYGVRGIPHAFIVDRRGNLVWQGHPLQEDFEPAIEKYLSE